MNFHVEFSWEKHKDADKDSAAVNDVLSSSRPAH